jgi:ferredoxin-NADP reductase
VEAVRPETARVKTFRLGLERPTAYLAGQHFVVRLRAPDGYTAQRSYSVASPPDGSALIELTVERLPEGEVSTFLHDEVVVGDRLEVRGPIGGYFTWDGASRALLVGGGIGLVPLWAMLRQARATGQSERVRLVASVRTPEDLPYADALPGPEVRIAYTRRAPDGCGRPVGRLGAGDLAPALAGDPTVYVCGSAGFADHATDLLAGLGVGPGRIRVERFGPTS